MNPQEQPKQTTKMPLESTFAESLALHTILAEACKVLDDPSADYLTKMVAENAIKTILDSVDLPEQ